MSAFSCRVITANLEPGSIGLVIRLAIADHDAALQPMGRDKHARINLTCGRVVIVGAIRGIGRGPLAGWWRPTRGAEGFDQR